MRTHGGIATILVSIALGSALPEASAGVHRVAPGDSLWRIARARGCDVDVVRRANRLSGTRIRPGQKLRIPSCDGKRVAAVARARGGGRERAARAVLGVPPTPSPRTIVDTTVAEPRGRGLQSIGRPQRGRLVNASVLPRNPAAWFIRRPERAYGTRATVSQLQRVIQRVRRHFPRVHALAIGDLSARRGGKITMHGSHQSGRDVDLGFYFKRAPRGYPAAFALATEDEVDVAACFALFTALADTAGRPGGVERMYMTYETQALFHRLGRQHGISPATLDRLFQYPHGHDSDQGLFQHEPGHDEHIHVRFSCAPTDRECR